MNEDSAGALKQIISTVDSFILVYENKRFPKSASLEDVKNAFKLGNFIEKTILNFKAKNSLPQFMNILNKCWENNNRTKMYPEIFLEKACDSLLKNFFQYPYLPEKNLDIAIRIYTTLHPKERLQSLISELILRHSSVKVLMDSCGDSPEREYHVLLGRLLSFYESSKGNELNDEINKFLSISMVEEFLYLLLGILSLTDLSVSQKHVQKQILECLVQKMLDRSILSKSFWITLCKIIDRSVISKACDNHREFLNSLLNFLIFLGSTMDKNEENVWTPNTTMSYCPEIGFHDILQIFKLICKENSDLNYYVVNRLYEAKDNTECILWDEIRLLLTN